MATIGLAMIGVQVEISEDIPIYEGFYFENKHKGTVRKGTTFRVIGLPTPKKKMYKLEQINNKFDDGFLYLRKSEFDKYCIIQPN